MKTLIASATALLLLSAAPALAISCCGGGGKGKVGMCAKGGAAMNHAAMRVQRAAAAVTRWVAA